MGNAVICGNAVSPVNTTSPSEPTPSQREQQLRYVKSVLALPRLQRRRRESVMPPVYDTNGQVINADDRMALLATRPSRRPSGLLLPTIISRREREQQADDSE